MIRTRFHVITITFLSLLFMPHSHVKAVFDAETSGFFKEINAYRANKGVEALSIDAKLQNAADWMSEDMLGNCASTGSICSHADSTGRNFSLRLNSFDYPAGISAAAGENLAWGSRLATSINALNMWKNSPGHNANMLYDSYKAIGISRSCNVSVCVWVTDFGSRLIQAFDVPSSQELPAPAIPKESSSFQTKTPSISSIQNFSEGSLLRAKGDIDVYVIKYSGSKKFKRLILNTMVFENYRHLRWSDVIDVDRDILDSFATSDLVRVAKDSRVFKLFPSGDAGKKRWVSTSNVFARMRLDWDAIYEINRFDRDSYAEEAPLE